MRSGRLLACLVVLAVASPAMATFSTINSAFPGEDSQLQIFNHIYGPSFSATGVNNRDYVNNTNTIKATRVEDVYTGTSTPASPLSVTGNVGNDDQVWHADFRFVSAKAVFAAFNQEFGYFDPTTNMYVPLITNIGHDYNVSNTNVNISSLSGDTLRWARGGDNGVFSSRNSDNPDHADHMVTYRIDGLSDASSGMITWLLFWEDHKTTDKGADFDYQDLVVQIKAMPLNTTPTPEPAALGSLLVCGFVGLARRRRA